MDIIVVATQTCTLLTLMYALCIKIGFFEAEGISPDATAAGMLIIQLAPFAIALVIFAWLFRGLYGDLVGEKAKAMKGLRRSLTRQFTHTRGLTVLATPVAEAQCDPPMAAHKV